MTPTVEATPVERAALTPLPEGEYSSDAEDIDDDEEDEEEEASPAVE